MIMNVTSRAMLDVARSYLGYTEKNDTSDLVNGEAGNKNMTIFWRRLEQADFFDGMVKQGLDWCAGFICACSLEVTGNKADGRRLLCQDRPYGAGCVQARQDYIANGRLFKTPHVGDQAFFGNDIDDPDHTGIVEEVYPDGTFVTIEGNWSNRVMRVKHNPKSDLYWKTMDFGRPRYSDAEATEDEKTNTSSSDVPERDSVANNGVYVVKEDDTLSEIAERINVSVDDLVAWNNIPDPNLINVGQTLRIVSNGTVTETPKTPQDASELRVGDSVSLAYDSPVYGTQTRFFAWVYDAVLYVRQIDGDRVIISTERNGDITGAVDRKYLRKI